MTRLYGRALPNERVVDYVPDVRFERTSMIGALGPRGIVAPLTYKGTLNSELFRVYIEKCLAPVMNSGDTLVLDNLSVHRVKGCLKPLIEKGVCISFLPPYSPDFNPIELAWSKVKAFLRKFKARDSDTLLKALGDALASISPSDSLAWIRHCGYSC